MARCQWNSCRGRLFCEPASPSRELRLSFCKPQRIPAKKSKNGHSALIWYLLHAGCFHYANTWGKWNNISRSNWANQEESDSYHFLFLFQIPYRSEEKQGSEPVCQKRNGKFQSDRSGRISRPPPEVLPNILRSEETKMITFQESLA